MQITEISLMSVEKPARLEDLNRLCEPGAVRHSESQPTCGTTGYLDVWDETYQPGTFGKDMHGRQYLILPQLVVTDGKKLSGFMLCVFQRYSGDGRILVSTVRPVEIQHNIQKGYFYFDPIPHELSEGDIEALTKIMQGEAAIFPAFPDDLVCLASQLV